MSDFKVVTGVVGEDVHTVGISIIEKNLRESGFNVISLGVKQPYRAFLDAVEREGARCVVMSSLNGHAARSCEGMGTEIKSRGLKNVYFYIGGNLTINSDHDIENTLCSSEYGFDRAYHQVEDVSVLIEDIKEDIR